jgi:exodeoxyribonuclease VII small subunit
MMKNESEPVEQLSFEKAYAELESIVAALESGEQSLEQAMTLFERGQALTKHCAGLLDKSELKVRQLIGESLQDFGTGA